MRRLALAVVLAVFAAVGTASATTTHVHQPHKHLKVTRHFKPTGTPSVAMAGKIMEWEQARWGGPTLKNRAWCESGWRWNVGNGTYNGILALGSVAWSILWPGTPRDVRLIHKHRRWARAYRVTIWDSGRKTRKHIGSVHQKVKVIERGKLPKHPSVFHAWAAIRAVQRYVAGLNHRGTVTWSCGL